MRLYVVYTEVGCGNAVLRIYSNRSTMSAYELCGVVSDQQEIVTASNSVRFKYDRSLARSFYALRFSCILMLYVSF